MNKKIDYGSMTPTERLEFCRGEGNSQMVSVPREQMERFSEVLEVLSCHITVADDSLKAGRAIHSEMSAILAKPAEQHHGEPVALPAKRTNFDYKQLGDDGYVAAKEWNACLDEIAKLGPLYTRPVQGEPVDFNSLRATGISQVATGWNKCIDRLQNQFGHLYTHADPAEVERLRDENRRLHEAGEFLDGVNQGIEDKLRAQLAERDALLRGLIEYSDGLLSDCNRAWSRAGRCADDDVHEDADYLKAVKLLSASAERNQCDGCQAGIPVVNGAHRMGKPGGYSDSMACQAAKYASAEPSAPAMYPKCTMLNDENVRYSNESQGYVDPNRLSQGGLPSAPVDRDERAEFESYCAKVGLPLERMPSGEYLTHATRFVSQGWHARAALEHKS